MLTGVMGPWAETRCLTCNGAVTPTAFSPNDEVSECEDEKVEDIWGSQW